MGVFNRAYDFFILSVPEFDHLEMRGAQDHFRVAQVDVEDFQRARVGLFALCRIHVPVTDRAVVTGRDY